MTFPTSLPDPRTPYPHEAPPLRWGVMGPGWIAERFVTALQRHTTQQVTVAGSRDLSRATVFAAEHGIEHAVEGYESVATHPDVDIVYVATTHDTHAELAIMAMEAGKHVLVEKPIATNGADARRIAEVSARTGRYCCEALWTLFLPKWDVLRQLIDTGALGRLRSLTGSYGEHFGGDHRIFKPQLAGGPLLDLGIYPLSMITSLAGAPRVVQAVGVPDPRGVIGQLAAVMAHDDDVLSSFSTTMYGEARNELRIIGDDAVLVVEPLHNSPGPLSLRSAGGERELRWAEEPADHLDGLHFQAVEAARRIAAGHTETPIRTLAASVTTMEAVDAIEAQLRSAERP